MIRPTMTMITTTPRSGAYCASSPVNPPIIFEAIGISAAVMMTIPTIAATDESMISSSLSAMPIQSVQWYLKNPIGVSGMKVPNIPDEGV